MNSAAASATGLRVFRRAIVASFVFQQEITAKQFGTFFDSIGQKGLYAQSPLAALLRSVRAHHTASKSLRCSIASFKYSRGAERKIDGDQIST
jgi:hypothetical protein